MSHTSGDPRDLLPDFGLESFRPGQERAIRALLSGRDVLALFPTGAGKSLVYQLTAQLLPGATVVVSPLIALMKDQVESIAEQGIDAGLINSTRSEGAITDELRRAEAGESRLLYVTPERLQDAEFLAAMRGIPVSLFVVDEAHCISEWGHSFRASYLGLPDAIRELGRPTLLALTATATPWVRQEIVERLGMRDPAVEVRGIDRPNLFLEVHRVEDERDDRRVLERLLHTPDNREEELPPGLAEAMGGSGIIYTATTAAARQTAEWLREWGIAADYYHGQRRKSDRERVQDAFMGGDLRVIVATNAFGLGVDKPDVRFVIHRDIPGSVEAYFQEAGRAGRDGQPARCILIYRPGDLGRAAFLAAGGRLTPEELERAWAGMRERPDATARQLREATGLGQGDLARAVELLEEAGAIRRRRGRVQLRDPEFDLSRVSLEQEEHRRAYERSRVEMMRGYAETGGCRRRFLLGYFGEEYEDERCGMCDNDVSPERARRPFVDERGADASTPFRPGDRVEHPQWGEGTVHQVGGDGVTVLFEAAGYKTLAADLVRERDLLRKVA